MRVKFAKGRQREFFKQILEKSGCPSLRALKQFGFDVNYQTLKSYYTENRTLPLELFNELCTLAEIDKKKLKFKLEEDNWGKVRGGKR